jgi:hypothetical protein
VSPEAAAVTAASIVLYPGAAHDVPGGTPVGVGATHNVVGAAKTVTGVATCKTVSNDVMTSATDNIDSILFNFILFSLAVAYAVKFINGFAFPCVIYMRLFMPYAISNLFPHLIYM